MAFASGMDRVCFYHNTTGRARGTPIVVGPSLSRYSQPLPTFKDTHGLLAACTVTPRGLPTMARASVYCPPNRPTDPALYRDTLEALLPCLAAKYPLHLLDIGPHMENCSQARLPPARPVESTLIGTCTTTTEFPHCIEQSTGIARPDGTTSLPP